MANVKSLRLRQWYLPGDARQIGDSRSTPFALIVDRVLADDLTSLADLFRGFADGIGARGFAIFSGEVDLGEETQ